MLKTFVTCAGALLWWTASVTPIQAADVEGSWVGEMAVPGQVEFDVFSVVMSKSAPADGAIEAALTISGRVIQMTGTLADEGQLDMSGDFEGTAIHCRLQLRSKQLIGTLTRAGQVTGITLARGRPEPAEAELEVDLYADMPLTVSLDGLSADLAEDVNDTIERELFRQKAVGVTIAIVLDGELRDVRSIGFEDFHAGVPATDLTMYRWASISKPLTSLAAFQLQGDGQLDFDADVRDYVPEFPEKAHTITSRLLMAHLSGVVHYRAMRIRTVREYNTPHPWDNRVLALDMFKESDLLFEPGTRYHYSTPAFSLLGAVVERAAEQRYADFVNERIAVPLGMTTLQPDRGWIDIPHRSQGYHVASSGNVVQSGDDNILWKLPAGGFISTTGDLARFGIGLCSNEYEVEPPLEEPLLSSEGWDEFYTVQQTTSGESTRAGLGIRIGEVLGHRSVEHSGAQNKTATFLIAVPSRGVAVAIMCNTSGTRWNATGLDILKAILKSGSAG